MDQRTAPPDPADSGLLEGYEPLTSCYDEAFAADGGVRADGARAFELLNTLGPKDFQRRQRLAEAAFRRGGVTFSVYSDRRGVEKTFPFDLIPRVVSASEWERVERGLAQRVRALDAFLKDIYGDQRMVREGRISREFVESSEGWRPELRGLEPPAGVHIHVAGIDLVRGPDGAFRVLEDNVRVPSGVSYVLENRAMMKRILPRVFRDAGVRSVDDYPAHLRDALLSVSPEDPDRSLVVVLTPGPFNSAYFEHSYLARRMGCPLVEGRDLFVWEDKVFVKTTHGPQRVHVIYRRVDDEFLDPEVFRADSTLGVPGLVRAYRAGNVTLANALGNGIADDKAIYAFVPDMIRFYLSEEPLLAQVDTYLCARDADLKYVLDHLGELVVKEVDASGGYGMLIGPKSTREQIRDYAERIRSKPRGFIAQPVIELSTCPAWVDRTVGPRRVDLRPDIVSGKSLWVLPGGLTRVALVEGSYVVNSSQGGGSKDTWVLEEGGAS